MIDLSISIVNHNNKECLNNCLASVYSNTSGINFEVIVIDNGSSDGSAEAVRQCFPLVNVIENSDNK